MDPNATWDRLRDALGAGDIEEFLAACEDLQQWCERGGVYPKAWGERGGAWRSWLAMTTLMTTEIDP